MYRNIVNQNVVGGSRTVIGISNVINTMKNNYATLNLMSFYSKEPIEYNEVNKFYASSHYPGQTIATIYKSKFEADQDILEEGKEDKCKVILQTQQNQEDSNNRDVFNISKYFSELNSLLFGKQIMHSKLMTSTQTVSLKYLSNTRQGLVVLADQQTAGKGRGGNNWTSPLGCLLFSFKCKQSDGNKLPFLQYVAGLAMIEAVHSFPIASDLNIRLKWPNDIYAVVNNGDDNKENLKIGGILCQSNYLNNEFDVVIGIGINVTNSNNPSTSINQMIHNKLKKEGGDDEGEVPIYISRESLLSKFFNTFEQIYITFTKEGFKPLEKRYTDKWMHTNQIVQLKEKEGQYVKVIGLETNGFLKAIECDKNGNQTSNETHELHPDGTSFDITNLILKKKENPI